MEQSGGWQTTVTSDLTEFLADLDMFYLGTANADGHPGEVERAIVFTVEAWDVNCPQHIHKRFSQKQVAPVIEQLQGRIAELEAMLKATESKGEDS
jgi:predicted pyridoxine 5'-phosphate oxidase superfamily flavin-nucleotide-binding protein